MKAMTAEVRTRRRRTQLTGEDNKPIKTEVMHSNKPPHAAAQIRQSPQTLNTCKHISGDVWAKEVTTNLGIH